LYFYLGEDGISLNGTCDYDDDQQHYESGDSEYSTSRGELKPSKKILNSFQRRLQKHEEIGGDFDDYDDGGQSEGGGGAGGIGSGRRRVPKVFSKEAISKFRAWLFNNITVCVVVFCSFFCVFRIDLYVTYTYGAFKRYRQTSL